MKKTFYLFSLIFLLNGCVESIALIGSTAGGASSGKMVQSSLQQAVSYGIKKSTGKTPLGHALAFNEKHNPEKKRETCINFIEKTRSEFCTIAKKKISLANKAVKEKIVLTVKKNIKIMDFTAEEEAIKVNKKITLKDSNYIDNFNQPKKSPRELAITLQTELKNSRR